MLLGSLLSLALMQEPEPRAEAASPEPAPLPYDRKAPMNGGRLLAGGAIACATGAVTLAADIQLNTEYQGPFESWTGVSMNYIAMPICLHTVIPGAALRGRTDARRDRLMGTRQDTSKMFRAGLGLTIAGPLITGLALGSAKLVPFESAQARRAAGFPLHAMGASGFASFATGLSLIARARNYEAEFGGRAGIWTPRGAGSLTAAAVFGAGSLAIPILAARTEELRGFGSVAAPLLRLMFASTLLGAVGGHLHGQWLREHGESPSMYRRAKAAFGIGVTLVSIAPVLGIIWGATAVSVSSGCPSPPPDDSETGPDGFGAFGVFEPRTQCEQDFATKLAIPAVLGIASLEIGAVLLGYATAWAPNHRTIIVREQKLSPWMLTNGFGISWSGRF